MSGAEALPQPLVTGEDVRAHQRVFNKIGLLFTDVGGDVDDANLLLEESWSGKAATSAVADIKELRNLLEADAGAADDAVGALRTYATAVDEARSEITTLQGKYDDEETGLSTDNGKIPDDATESEKQKQESANKSAFDKAVKPYLTRHGELMDELRTAEETCAKSLNALIAVLSPESMRGGVTGGKPDVDVGAYQSVAFTLNLAGTTDNDMDADKRADQFEAFVATLGRPPTSESDWKTAAMLNPESYLAKYQGHDANVSVSTITPQPGKGVVRLGWFIPAEKVFNVPDHDLGDDRGFDPSFNPEETRVAVYIDYENGLIIARNNPSVTTDGEVKVGTPDIKVQQHPDGRIRMFYDAQNPFAPPGASQTGHTVHGDIVVGTDGVSGRISDYPAFEVYHDKPGEEAPEALMQDEADSAVLGHLFGDQMGPVEQLPFMHEIGENGKQNLNDFYKEGMDGGRHDYEWRNPHVKYPDRYPWTEPGDPDDPPETEMVGE